MSANDFDSVSWRNEGDDDNSRPSTADTDGHLFTADRDTNGRNLLHHEEDESEAGPSSSGLRRRPPDYAGIADDGVLECTVDAPLKENDGTKDAYISYLVTTHVQTDFKTFARPDFSVRRRFTDFYFLYKTLFREYPHCAIPPLPDKQRMEYVRGDRFGKDFTQRRAWSLHRFVKRLTMHPVLRRAPIFSVFLESSEWNAYMRTQPTRQAQTTAGDSGPTGIFDNFTDTFVNAFTKINKPDRRFIEVKEKSDKLDEDLGNVEKTMVRVVRRETDLEADYNDLATQFRKLVVLEPEIEVPLQIFSASVEETSRNLKALKDHTDLNYLTSLRDMEAYIQSMRILLKTREQKQLDYEALIDYRNKAVMDRENLTNNPSSYHSGNSISNPASFLLSKMEDMRGVDHEAARRERLRKLELKIDELTREVESAKATSEGFDEEVIREVVDFERIKATEFRDTMTALSQRHIDFYQGVLNTWERFIVEMEAENDTVDQLRKEEGRKRQEEETRQDDQGRGNSSQSQKL
ncbi:intercellular trafficking and secretion [Ascosphaera aggregata]|nr:intercellular trafficking and secretion [Ascosphaera aggregata]